MSSFLSELGRQAPHIALAFLAARKGGPMALAALEGGMAEAQQRQEALSRQAQLDEERRSAQAAQEARAQSAEQRAADAGQREQEQADFRRKQAAIQTLWQAIQQQGETAADEGAAENTLKGQAAGLESFYGVPQGQLAGMVPNMAPAISQQKAKLAEQEYKRGVEMWGADQMANDGVTLHPKWNKGQPIKPSQLREMFMAPAMTATGEQAKPFVKSATEKNVPLEQQLLAAIQAGDKQLEQQIRVAMNARDAQMGGQTPRQRYSIQPITKPDGTTGLARVNVETGEVTVLGAGDVAFGKPTEGERKAASFYDRGSAADENALTFEDDLESLGSQLTARLPNLLVSQKGQQYKQAQREFTEARLRSESGAAVPPSEYENDARTYFIQPGDTLATIQQKQVARQRVLRGLKRQAGNLGATAKAPNDAGAEEWVRDPATNKLVKKGVK